MKPDCLKCNKWCCILYNITLTDREKNSGFYQINVPFYKISGQAQLAKKDDGSCIYLNKIGCIIYNNRPEMCKKYWCTDINHEPNEFVKIHPVNPQSAQIRCRDHDCKFNKDGLKCTNISPALDLYEHDSFDCHSKK